MIAEYFLWLMDTSSQYNLGTIFNDRIFNSGEDYADTLFGNDGNDDLHGRGGDDAYVVDSAEDRTLEDVEGGIDTVTVRLGIFLAANVENLTLDAGAGEISGGRDALHNKIVGNGYANNLMGHDGDDQLAGMGGHDVLDGGAGLNYLAGGFGDADVQAVFVSGQA